MAKIPDIQLVKMLDMSQHRIWQDPTRACKCFRCGKPSRYLAEVAMFGSGEDLKQLGLDCFVLLKGKQSGNPLSPAAIRASVRELLVAEWKKDMGQLLYSINLVTGQFMGGPVLKISISGVSTGIHVSADYGLGEALRQAKITMVEQQWQRLLEDYRILTGSRAIDRELVCHQTHFAPPSCVTLDGVEVPTQS